MTCSYLAVDWFPTGAYGLYVSTVSEFEFSLGIATIPLEGLLGAPGAQFIGPNTLSDPGQVRIIIKKFTN